MTTSTQVSTGCPPASGKYRIVPGGGIAGAQELLFACAHSSKSGVFCDQSFQIKDLRDFALELLG
ncbi:MAG TPA: hypothetical protein VK971_06450, partial [Thiohalobacter sp.]|nr:hypothetical protein [Thiohalobacter sp.]